MTSITAQQGTRRRSPVVRPRFEHDHHDRRSALDRNPVDQPYQPEQPPALTPHNSPYHRQARESEVELAAAKDSTNDPNIWTYQGVYANFGVAPGTTFHLDGINPMLRYDFELGMHWRRRKWEVAFGAEPWLLQYYERGTVGGGLHGVVTLKRRPVYVRAGAGSLTGIPGSDDDEDFRPAVGVLLGLGLEGGSESVTGRFGFDYHVSLDKAGRVNNTVLFALRLKF